MAAWSAKPSIIGAYQGRPRVLLNFADDGDFPMTGQALFIVFNNGCYGTMRMHQERNVPARVSGTD